MLAPPDPRPWFSLHAVSQQRGGTTVLHDVTLALPRTAVTALVGPSGSGKTSLLRLLNRLDDPTTGAVHFDGRPVAAYPVGALRRRVGFVFQTPTMFPGTVADNLAAAAAVARPPHAGAHPPPDPAADSAAAREAVLGAVELGTHYLDREAARLSGGEQQRVALARALMARPDVLLLDEPTAALDPEVADRLVDTIGGLAAAGGPAVVMVTHRLREARDASTHTVLLEAGRLVEAGPTRTLFDAPAEPRTRAYLARAR